MNTEQILQKYVNSLSQKTYDCFYLEVQAENLDKLLQNKDKEIGRLKKLLDDNDIDYKIDDDKGDEVSLSSIKDIKEEN